MRKPFSVHLVAVFHVELVAVPMPLEHFAVLVNFFGERALHDLRRPRAEPHAAAFFSDLALFIEQANNRLGRFLIELRCCWRRRSRRHCARIRS